MVRSGLPEHIQTLEVALVRITALLKGTAC